MNTQQIVICGNNIKILKNYPDNFFDSIVTDPPYGLGKEPNANEVLNAWITDGFLKIKGKGFMGNEWDSFVPQPIFWKEIFRVLKHGGYVVSFFGTRTYDWGVMSMRLAGFQIRDCIQWIYGSGFPKSYNVAKGIEGKNTFENIDLAKKWNGWGSALKPANEPIVLARKPLEKGLTIVENVVKWGTGGLNINDSRIGNENRSYKGMSNQKPDGAGTFRDDNWIPKDIEIEVNGRFPSNVILTHHPDCICLGFKKIKSKIDKPINRNTVNGTWNKNNTGLKSYTNLSKEGYGDENGEETIENWQCHENCPVKIIDEQSGILKSGKMTPENKRTTNCSKNGIYGKFNVNYPLMESYGDEGGASRFFYVAKASQWERNFGLLPFKEKRAVGFGYNAGFNVKSEGMFKERNTLKKNTHPTVKPIQLMQYLVRLVTPINGIVLDPFCGSGTTGIACKIDGFNFVGIELSNENTEISNSRIKAFRKEMKLLEDTIIYQNRNIETDISPNQLSFFDEAEFFN